MAIAYMTALTRVYCRGIIDPERLVPPRPKNNLSTKGVFLFRTER